MARQFIKLIIGVMLCLSTAFVGYCQAVTSHFRALVIHETGGHHIAYSKVAKPWLDKVAADSQFVVDYIYNMSTVDSALLARYRLIIQLDYPPYGWPAAAEKAFVQYLEEGRGGWIGFHHAGLLGEFDGYGMWGWFSQFMGGIRFKNYIPDFAAGTVQVEDTLHPVMRGIPRQFTIAREEWYTWDKSPRSSVKVLASVNEASYSPASTTRMGDHPVIWTNPQMKARNVYIFMGHGPDLFENPAYTALFRNAIMWASGR